MRLQRKTRTSLLGPYFLLTASLALYLSQAYPLDLTHPFSNPAVFLVFIPLLVGEAYVLVKNRYPGTSLFALTILSLTATIASSLHVVVLRQPTMCRPGLQGAGFPLPWNITNLPQPGPVEWIWMTCSATAFLPQDPSPVLLYDIIFLVLDTALYAALALGAMELYRSMRRQSRTRLEPALQRSRPLQGHSDSSKAKLILPCQPA